MNWNRKGSVIILISGDQSYSLLSGLSSSSSTPRSVSLLNSRHQLQGSVVSCNWFFISSGHTKWSGLSMWWPLCSKVTLLITPSLPRTCHITLPFFHFPRVFSSPTISTISAMSGTGGAFLFTRWLSNRLRTYSCFHVLQPCCLVSLSCLRSLLTSSLSSLVFSTWWAFCPHINMFVVKTCSSPPLLSRYVKGWLLKCFSMSMITISSCLKLRVFLPNNL